MTPDFVGGGRIHKHVLDKQKNGQKNPEAHKYMVDLIMTKKNAYLNLPDPCLELLGEL